MKRELLEVKNLDSCRHGKLLHFVNPNDIVYVPKVDFTISCKDEKIADGDWDLGLTVFNDTNYAYLSYRDVFFKGKKWEDTILFNGDYQAGAKRIAEYKQLSTDELRTWKTLRCRYLSFMFKSMRQFGYSQDPYSDFISIIIGRNGEIILNNGRHRLAAAKLLNIPGVPILIDVRHKEWINFKDSIAEYTTHHNGMVYAPLRHVDLKDIPARQDDRSNEVLSCISKNSMTVVDLGANWGSMCKVLEDSGRTCTAVEGDDVEFSFLERLRMDYHYDIVHSDVCDFIHDDYTKWDCVLALSIFHHLAKTKLGHSRLLKLLHKLNCKEMIFQMPDADEMKQFNSYKNYSSIEFVNLIIKNSCLNRYKEIGNRKNRRIFHLTKGD